MKLVANIIRALAGRSGQQDAQLNQNIVDLELARKRTIRPDGDPATNRTVALAQQAIQRAALRLPEIREDLNALPVDRPSVVELIGALLAIAIFFVIETYGALLVMRLREVPPGEQLPMAIGLAAFMVVVASQLRMAISDSNDPSVARNLRRAMLWLLWIALYLGVVVAVVVLRVSAAADEDTSTLFVVADAALVAAAVVAPSMMLEQLTTRFRRSWIVWRRGRQLRTEERRLERGRDRGEAVLAEMRAAQIRWDEDGERMRAEYTAAFKREKARLQQIDPANKAPPSTPVGANDND